MGGPVTQYADAAAPDVGLKGLGLTIVDQGGGVGCVAERVGVDEVVADQEVGQPGAEVASDADVHVDDSAIVEDEQGGEHPARDESIEGGAGDGGAVVNTQGRGALVGV